MRTAGIDLDLARASDALRSELIFLPDDGSVTRIPGGFVIRTPSNPGYWWGNSMRLDRPPRDGDFDDWTRTFAARVHAIQPASTHMTFGWDGPEAGAIGRFVDAGFGHIETLALAVERGDPVAAPERAVDAEIVRVAGDDWDALRRLQVETRDPPHSADAYDSFIRARIAGWQALEARSQGHWFAARVDGAVVAALGLFVEAARGVDGRRIGRFQNVTTGPDWRRRGYASRLVEHASHAAFAELDADVLYLMADAHDVARRVYEGCGYRQRSIHHGLERGS